MPPAAAPAFNPQLREHRFPANLDMLDDNAVNAVDRQYHEVVEQIGNVHDATLPGHGNIPLFGQRFTIPAAVTGGAALNVDWRVQANALNQTGPDAEYSQRRLRLSVLRSRRRSSGSRLNYGYTVDRTDGYGHTHNINNYEPEYRDALVERIERLVYNNPALENNAPAAIHAAAHTLVQEQTQMGALESMAAERKSGNPVFNALRNNKWLRAGVGLALSGIATGSALLGILPVTAAALALRSGISAIGGYQLGRTGWDAVQGRRDRRRVHADPRMAGAQNGGISGILTPRTTFERRVKVTGANARAGSSRPERHEFINATTDPAHEYYVDELTNRINTAVAAMTAGITAPANGSEIIRDAVLDLYNTEINPAEQERLRSDQHQSRRRHRAGIIGAVVMGALPFGRMIGVGMDLADGVHHASGAHAANAATPRPHGAAAHKAAAAAANKHHIAAAAASNGSSNGGGAAGTAANNAGATAGNTSGSLGYPNYGAGSLTGGSIGQNTLNPFQNIGLDGVHHERIHDGRLIRVIGAPNDPNRLQLVHEIHGQGSNAGYMTLQTANGEVLAEHLSQGPQGLTPDSLQKLQDAAKLHNTTVSTHFDQTGDGGKGRLDIGWGISPDQSTPTGANFTAGSGTNIVTLEGGPGNDTTNLFLNGPNGNVLLPDPSSDAGKALAGILHDHIINGDAVVPRGTLTPELVAQAKSELPALAGSADIYSQLSGATQAAIAEYVQSAIDNPGPGAGSQAAAARIRDILGPGFTFADNPFTKLTPSQWAELQMNMSVLAP